MLLIPPVKARNYAENYSYYNTIYIKCEYLKSKSLKD